MPTRRRDEPWWLHEATGPPLPVEGGLVTSRQRGAMAESWWSNRFIEVLESYGLGGRMQRGRRYARAGQVLDLEIRPSVVAAQVQGSRPRPYRVFLELRPPTDAQWEAIEQAMAAKVGFAAHLLAGEVPPELEAVFREAGVELFPARWSDLRTDCNCPDWGDPCKHIAAVLYVLADQLDADPWLLIEWRGRSREELLATLDASASSVDAGEEVAPWWPFGPGPLPDLPVSAATDASAMELLPTSGGVLDRLEEIDLQVAGLPLTEILRPAYERLEAADLSDEPPAPPGDRAARPRPRRPRPSTRAHR
jgi:uncharacterized Zn finger protein